MYSTYTRLLKKQRDLCKTPLFSQFLRLPCEMRSLFLWGQAQILILEIFYIFLWLIFAFLELEQISADFEN